MCVCVCVCVRLCRTASAERPPALTRLASFLGTKFHVCIVHRQLMLVRVHCRIAFSKASAIFLRCQVAALQASWKSIISNACIMIVYDHSACPVVQMSSFEVCQVTWLFLHRDLFSYANRRMCMRGRVCVCELV